MILLFLYKLFNCSLILINSLIFNTEKEQTVPIPSKSILNALIKDTISL